MTLPHILTLLLLLLACSSGSDSEPDSYFLIEFKKGIKVDPGNFMSSWNASNLANRDGCPSGWIGISCSSDGRVSSIALDRLGLAGDIKFNTLTGLYMLLNLTLSGNNFTGRIAPTLGSLGSVQRLDLSVNSFYGPIPGRINDMYSLNYLNLSRNAFTGGFPTGIHNLQQLKSFDLHSNDLWGDIGQLLSELKNVEYVDLSYNRFFGSISVGEQNVSSIANTVQFLSLSHNKLSGQFFDADSIRRFRNLRVLDLGDNAIYGQLPSFDSLPNLKVLRLGNNMLFGSIPQELLESLIPLEELDLSGNGFTGYIPKINSTTVTSLNLSSNRLSGSLPSSLGKCVMLDLSWNMIDDNISAVQNWETPLEFLDLSSNNLWGSLPNMTSQTDSLTTLRVSNNSLTGALPSLLGGFANLSAVDLSLNKLHGEIPAGLFMSSVSYLNLSGNQFDGSINLQSSAVNELLAMSLLQPMEYLDLSDNKLIGPLPPEIGNMGKLKWLSVARNSLSGQLPSELSKLTFLEYLDLSGNNFSGPIPKNLSQKLISFNVSYNNLSGDVPDDLKRFPRSFFEGNPSLGWGSKPPKVDPHAEVKGKSSSNNARVAIIVASVGAAVMIVFVLVAYYRLHSRDFLERSAFDSGQRPSLFKFHPSGQPPSTSLSFSNAHLLTSNSRSLSGQQTEFPSGIVEHSSLPPNPPNLMDAYPTTTSGRKSNSPDSPTISSSPRSIDAPEQPVRLDVYSPDRLAGELFFLDPSVIVFTAEELSRAPAEVLGRSSHGTLYKATLDNGHMLTVKWLRVGLVKNKKEFAKEVKKIGSMKHSGIIPLRAYYWGPREQERLLLADYIHGDSLALHLYETTPRRHSPLSFRQRLKVAVDVARCLSYLHDRGLPHGNLKPSNILLTGPDYDALLADYGLHRLMTPAGIAEQILNLGALGYRAPELENVPKPGPSLKADVYAFGVILMELLTRRSAGDIISGQSGAVDLTDWVRLCDQEGRGMDCIDRDIAAGEEHSRAMDELLTVSLRCILSVNERPNISQVFDDLCSISV
ncbi:hypothetical protein SAY86_024419 [Trapa natans]|uniref:Protein kinase domain-containing protein n=1 Tax=Trapa natans TaxID=22666 RepID=A0AAN7RBH7_TRANT|nr:hypothetical protein SAY86_024419 [Trapa natans]